MYTIIVAGQLNMDLSVLEGSPAYVNNVVLFLLVSFIRLSLAFVNSPRRESGSEEMFFFCYRLYFV